METANIDDDAREVVTNALIEQELIQQAANAWIFAVPVQEVDVKIAELRGPSLILMVGWRPICGAKMNLRLRWQKKC